MLHHSLHDLRQTNLRPDELARMTSDLYNTSPCPSSPPSSPLHLAALADTSRLDIPSATPASASASVSDSTHHSFSASPRFGSSRSSQSRTSAHDATLTSDTAPPTDISVTPDTLVTPDTDRRHSGIHDSDTLSDRRQVDIPVSIE